LVPPRSMPMRKGGAISKKSLVKDPWQAVEFSIGLA
jgi:hypothetical protein